MYTYRERWKEINFDLCGESCWSQHDVTGCDEVVKFWAMDVGAVRGGDVMVGRCACTRLFSQCLLVSVVWWAVV